MVSNQIRKDITNHRSEGCEKKMKGERRKERKVDGYVDMGTNGGGPFLVFAGRVN